VAFCGALVLWAADFRVVATEYCKYGSLVGIPKWRRLIQLDLLDENRHQTLELRVTEVLAPRTQGLYDGVVATALSQRGFEEALALGYLDARD
jgi:hypothetical protein